MAELSVEALRNARDLFHDAELLHSRGRLASAFTLVGLAADELGKHVLVTSFFGGREESDEEWRKFWRRFRHHESKLGDALWGAWAGDLLSEDPPPNIKEFHGRRLSAIYVDIAPDGTIQTPRGVVTEGHVSSALDMVRRELAFCEDALGNTTPEALGRQMERMRDSTATDDLRATLKGLGSVGAMSFAIAVRAGIDTATALELARVAYHHSDPPGQPPTETPHG